MEPANELTRRESVQKDSDCYDLEDCLSPVPTKPVGITTDLDSLQPLLSFPEILLKVYKE